jgi:hypothetical protein
MQVNAKGSFERVNVLMRLAEAADEASCQF